MQMADLNQTTRLTSVNIGSSFNISVRQLTMARLPELTPPESSESRVPSVHHHDVVTERPGDLDSLRLIGTTRFEPMNDVKTILITGGAGFMLVYILATFTLNHK